MSSGIPSGLTAAEIASALAPFWTDLSEDRLLAIRRYIDILLLWNHKVSLTAIDDPREIVSRHFGESLFAGKMVSFEHGRLADVGTGAGFPGIPLKIAFPDLEVTLIEPNLKKSAFLTEVIGALDLSGVRILKNQYNEIAPSSGKFDFICSRALGNYKSLLRWARNALEPDGCVILWIGLEDSFLVGRNQEWIWGPPVRIPESQKRLILVGRPKPSSRA